MDLFIVQKSSLEGIDPATMEKNAYFRTVGQAVGTGPFIVKAYSAGQSMELIAQRQLLARQAEARHHHPARVQGHRVGADRVRDR